MPFDPSQSYMQTVAQLESAGDPLAMSPLSSAAGLYQFTGPTAKAYGLDDPSDPAQATAAMRAFTSDNYATLSKMLGRPPTDAELYLAHQQGASGAAKLLKNPETPAAQLIGKKALTNNGGKANMTAADFSKMWLNKYAKTAAKLPGAPDPLDASGDQVAQNDTSDPLAPPSGATSGDTVDYPDGAQQTFQPGTPQSVKDEAWRENRLNSRLNGHADPIGAGQYLAQNFGHDGPISGTQVSDSGQIMNDAGDLLAAHDVHDENDLLAQAAAGAGGDTNDILGGHTPNLFAKSAVHGFDPSGATGKGRTAVDNFNQGTMMGWGHEITDPLGIAGASIMSDPQGIWHGITHNDVNDPALAEQFANARGDQLTDLAAERAAHPVIAGASQIGGGVTGAVGLSKLIPGAIATRAAQLAKIAPNTTAALVGGGGAAINALGEAPGVGSQRFDNLGWNVPLGMAGGVTGYQLAKLASKGAGLVADRFGPSVKDAIESLKGKFGLLDQPPPPPPGAAAAGALAGDAADLAPMKVAGILDEEGAAKLQDGRVLPMTAGERSQNVKTQRLEEIAKKAGSVPFQKAVAAQQDAAYKPFTSILGDAQQLDPIALNGRTQDEMSGAANLLRSQYDTLGKNVNAAYKAAGEGAQGVSIDADAIKTDFLGKVNDTLATENVMPGDIPALDKNLGELNSILNPSEEDAATTTALKLDKLEAWKKRLNRTIGNMQAPADARIAKMVSQHYDSFLGDLSDDAIVNGDTAAIDAFKNARSLASQKFKFYESDAAVQKILDNRELSGTQLVNTILGANRMSGRGDDGRIVETMLDLAGDNAPQMQDAMRKGVLSKVLNDGLSPTIDPTTANTAAQRQMIDFGKMKKSLGALMQQKETFNTLFTPEEQGYFKQFHQDLSQIASKQPGAVNNSSTGAYMADMVEGLGKIINNPLLRNIPGGGAVTTMLRDGLEKQAASIVQGKAEAGLGEFMAKAFNQIDTPKVFYGGYLGGTSVDPIGNAAGAALTGGNNGGN